MLFFACAGEEIGKKGQTVVQVLQHMFDWMQLTTQVINEVYLFILGET
jgi:hypothetical protein